MMKFIIWKIRRKVDDGNDYFMFSIKREGYHALPLTSDQFNMLFPEIKPEQVPEVPETGIITIQGILT